MFRYVIYVLEFDMLGLMPSCRAFTGNSLVRAMRELFLLHGAPSLVRSIAMMFSGSTLLLHRNDFDVSPQNCRVIFTELQSSLSGKQDDGR